MGDRQLKANPRLWFGTETNPYDPHSQTEDLGDDNMKASAYGIKNLQRILPQLPMWKKKMRMYMRTSKTCIRSLPSSLTAMCIMY